MSCVAETGIKFERAVKIMARLRAPGGCPWDREQTFDSIKPFTLEETYEVLEAIDNRDWEELKGELGDLLLQVLFYSEMAREEKHFTIDDVLERLADKLIARHPHVFGDVKAETSAAVLRNWQALKAEEKKQRAGGQGSAESESVLAGVSSRIPAVLEAYKLSSRAAHVGLERPEINYLLDKVEEELEELREQLSHYPAPGPHPPNREVAGAAGAGIPQELRGRIEDEVGDLLFTAVNVARYLQLDPESALRRTNRKFRRRFQQVEAMLQARGVRFEQMGLAQLEELWQSAKLEDSR
ncbi:MAG: nucleoside triphosphate pyrophosphohydrolase [Acidobacteria bacterium]|nr:nucleoside triphosphate pyrophosphohydrolase [Acidobacteriota bacterium]